MKNTVSSRIVGYLPVVALLVLSACDSAGLQETPLTYDGTEYRTGQLSIVEIAGVTSTKTLVRELDDRVVKPVRSRLEVATPEQIRALRDAKTLAMEIVELGNAVTPEALETMQRVADAALAPFITAENALYLEAIARRISELDVSSSEIYKTARDVQTEESLGKVDPCTSACETSYLTGIVQIEAAYLGGLAGCAFTGPISPICFGVATAVKTTAVISSTLNYTSCVKTCRESS